MLESSDSIGQNPRNYKVTVLYILQSLPFTKKKYGNKTYLHHQILSCYLKPEKQAGGIFNYSTSTTYTTDAVLTGILFYYEYDQVHEKLSRLKQFDLNFHLSYTGTDYDFKGPRDQLPPRALSHNFSCFLES